MKRILLTFAFLIGSIVAASAACVSPAVMHDFPGTSFNMSLATNAGDGNCSSNVTIVNTLPAYAAIPAFKIDQTTPGTTNLVALAANQSVNVAQINAVTPLMGNGATGTGSQRITISNDNTIPTGWPTAANQTTGNTSVGNIDTNTGAIADAAATQGSTGSISAKLRTVTAQLNTGNGSLATIATNSGLPLPAQTGIGNVNIGAVQSAGSAYETVAASQTAQAMGATGAAGDYLSHCILYPVTTSPGVLTVFDGTSTTTNNVITFAGGATSLSNLSPVSFPIGAISLNSGGWKVTTGANLLAICFGKFT